MLETRVKSKNIKNKEKWIINLVVLALVIITSAGICLCYGLIESVAKKEERNFNPFTSTSFTDKLGRDNYVLYYQLENEKLGGNKSPSDILVRNDLNYEEEGLYLKDEINGDIYVYEERLLNDADDIEYYAFQKKVDENNNEKVNVVTNNNELEILSSEDLENEALKKLEDEYDFYIVMNYDSQGNLNMSKINGADKLTMYSGVSSGVSSYGGAYNGVSYLNTIKDTTFIYGIKDRNSILSNYYYYSEYVYWDYIAIVLVVVSAFILFISLVIPYRFTKKLIGVKSVVKIPFGILFVVFTSLMTGFYILGGQLAVGTIKDTLIYKLQSLYLNYTFNSIMLGIVNLVWWIIGFYILFNSMTYIKFIFNKGFLKFIKENTITVKILVWIKKIIKYFINNIDIREKNTKKLIIVVGINVIALSIMFLFGAFSILGIIVYAIIIFILAKKYMDDINIKYNKLLKSTNAIAQGDLDIEINEDLGILNPLKEEVGKIQRGFKKAVEKEVKSEKMKTELISNVSHDLKTPLTSIITYVDLLKDDNLSNEKKKQYLDVLDRKSQSLQYLIEDLFEISKVNSKNISLNLSDVDLVYLMKQTLLELDYKIKETNLKIKTNFNKDKIIYPLDSQRTFRVFENLITNIIKYSLEGSRVYIDIFENDKDIKITLKNIAKEEIDFNSKDITERFVRGDKSRNAEGSGLGLAIAKSFVEVQGGKFDIVLDGDLFKVIIEFNKDK